MDEETKRNLLLDSQYTKHITTYISSEYKKEDWAMMIDGTLDDLVFEIADLGFEEHMELNDYYHKAEGFNLDVGKFATKDMMNREIAFKMMRDVIDIRMVEYNVELLKGK